MIQIRNLNIDPEVYLKLVPPAKAESLGVPAFLKVLENELPQVKIGNYTREAPK
jgi:hypothetical protein